MKLKMIILYVVFFLVSVFLGFAVTASQAQAQDITLQWDANTEPNLAGYNIYESVFGAMAGNEWVKIDQVGKEVTEYTAAGRDDYTSYAYQITAFNDQGNESFVSNVAYLQHVPGAPINVKVIINVNP